MSSKMHIPLCDDLEKFSDRLYICSQALLHGDETIHNHRERVANELVEIWMHLEDIIEAHRDLSVKEEEEVKKFNQGFAYGR